jgi:hypothetical protein
METQNLTKLTTLITANRKFANALYDLVQNASSIEENLALITPGIDWTGFSQELISETLYNLEAIRQTLRAVPKSK